MSCVTPRQETERPTNPRASQPGSVVPCDSAMRPVFSAEDQQAMGEFLGIPCASFPVSLIDGFTIKDSGERQQFDSGMVRDITEGKVDYSLVLDGPMFKRWAIHLTNGAKKYAKRNWMKASGKSELDRFRESALRHMFQWFAGDTDEDHAAAVMFNLNGAAYVADRMKSEPPTTP